ncbi:MAG TPA: F0F1 ATP synthase subunit A [Thermomicrobiales bacterium]|nr:F0F1 ATP synthase subunit A [Thermomicrobiales bacterium]
MDLHISLAAEVLFHIGPIPVTNSMLTMFIVMAAILIVFTLIARRAQTVPSHGQSIVEMLVEFILNLVEGTAGKTFGRRALPLIAGLFIFILFANFSGLLPGMGTIGVNRVEHEAPAATELTVPAAGDHSETATTTETAGTSEAAASEEHTALVPFFRAPTADINMTLAMSILAFGVVQVVGIRAHGVGGRIKHMANPPFLFPIEVISEVSRIISLSARLFGNVFAGEVLLGVMYAMGAAIKIAVVPFLFPVIFMGLEVLFGTIQALVFALLTLIYLVLAGAHDDHAEEHAPAHGAEPASSLPAAAPSGD